ncbi:hypothetical protein M9H77_31607 [Catharanthus roseus]|uniref:Uncharacterized protein n=1 Tax=Catharanthus roseus TaxID=4058 RepID=A0ACC0A1K9_CATRO|nr:hypothetical protein M9H77_31607 [Catharanthus roseus]
MLVQSHVADDEVFDQKRIIEESCKSKCAQSFSDYLKWQKTGNFVVIAIPFFSENANLQDHDSKACARRIDSDNSGEKHCTGQYFDYWSCVDKCVAPKLFTQLK